MAEIIQIEDARLARMVRPPTELERYALALIEQRPELMALPSGIPDTPAWANDIPMVCAYAKMVYADHRAEGARIDFDAKLRGLANWTGADDLKARVDENNHQWNIYCGIVRHLAALPAADRWEATLKRNTIGRLWLRTGSELSWLPKLREGCAADDHFFPPSLRLENKPPRKRRAK